MALARNKSDRMFSVGLLHLNEQHLVDQTIQFSFALFQRGKHVRKLNLGHDSVIFHMLATEQLKIHALLCAGRDGVWYSQHHEHRTEMYTINTFIDD